MLIERFLTAIDAAWQEKNAPKIPLRIIGSTALMLQTTYQRGTKDSDVLETPAIDSETQRRLRALAGKGSPLHDAHRLYLEIVPAGLPFLPQGCLWHAQSALNARLSAFEVAALDVTDVLVSKLKRFNANDVDDVAAIVALDLVEHRRFVSRFLSAVDLCSDSAHATDLPDCVDNFHRVERDFFGVDETEIELPSWCD